MAEHKTIGSANGIVHYWISRSADKNAECLVFTHGLTADHTMFEEQEMYFSGKYTLITWDVPLHGLSRPYKNFSYEAAAAELKTILENERIEKAVLIGMSMGGYPSQMFADRYPEAVLGFVALDTTPFGPDYYSAFDRWCMKRVEPMAKCYPDRMLRKRMAKSVSRTTCAYDMMINMLAPLTKAEICAQMGIAYAGFLKENKNMRFAFPVLILIGEYDTTGKVRKYCETWARLEGHPLHIIKGAAHFANGDNAVAVNREIEDFISRL